MSADEVLAAPASFFLGKLAIHHDVLSPRALVSIHCVRGGPPVRRGALTPVPRRGRPRRRRTAGCGAARRRRGDDRRRRRIRSFDAVILAVNADQALGLLDAPTERERALLGPWRYKEGRVVVHRDASAFPRRELIQGYTFLYRERGSASRPR